MKKLIIFFIALFLFLICGNAHAAFPGDFELLGSTEIPAPDSTLTDIKYVFRTADFPTDMDKWIRVDGRDLRATSDSDGNNELHFEIVDPSDPLSEVWVNIPSHPTSAYNVYWWGASPSATAPAASDADFGSEGVWADCGMVMHMKDNTTSEVIDSTTNDNNGTKLSANNPEEEPGQIGDAQRFSSDYIAVGIGTNLANIFSGGGTLSVWVNIDSDGGNNLGEIVNRRTGWFLRTNNDAGSFQKITFGINFSGGLSYWITTSVELQNSTWTNITITYDSDSATNDPTIYVDSLPVALTDSNNTGAAVDDSGSSVYIGDWPSNNRQLDGIADEVKVTSILRTADYIEQEYANQSVAGGAWMTPSALTTPSNVPVSWDVGAGETWATMDDVVWASVYNGDTINDNSSTPYILDGNVLFPILNPVIIDGSGSLLDGSTLVADEDWSNVSGDIYRATVTFDTMDYTQTETPGSPSVNELWYHAAPLSVPDQMTGGRVYKYDGTDWNECTESRQPYNVWKNDILTYPVVTETPTTSFGSGANTSAAWDGHADDYWIGCTITVMPNTYYWATRIIYDSSGSVVNHRVIQNFQNGDHPAYIIGPYTEMTTEGEWWYDVANSYLYIYSADPTAHEWRYSDNGAPIFIKDCSGVTIRGYTIKRTNDCGIFAYRTNGITVDQNILTEIWAQNNIAEHGAICIIGDAPFNTSSPTPLDTATISNNNVSHVRNGSGIYSQWYDNVQITHNVVTNVGDETLTSGQPDGIRIYRICDNANISNNVTNYCMYSGIFIGGGSLSPDLGPTNALIDNNYANHTMNGFNDGGAIYLANGVNNTATNNIIEFTTDRTGVAGIYLDLGIDDTVVDDNIFYAIFGLTPDTSSTYGALFENSGSGTSGNQANNNTIYDDDCPILKKAGGVTGWTGSPTAAGYAFGTPDEYGNVRYTEGDYPYLGGGAQGGAALLLGLGF